MDVAGIAKVAFTSPDRVRDVLNNFNSDGFGSLDPRTAGGVLRRRAGGDDISHNGLGELLQKEEVSFQAVKTWRQSTDPDDEPKKNRVLELYNIADGKAEPGPTGPTVLFSMDEFGPIDLQPRSGRQ